MHCFWCRHPFHHKPIGCPVRYDAHRLTKTYQSEITKDVYRLRENITPTQASSIQMVSDDRVQMSCTARNYLVTDGVFCSFNCAYAFVLDNQQNPLYLFSKNLLCNMYAQSLQTAPGKMVPPLQPAASWRLLKAYGGHMTIDEFRRNFTKAEYENLEHVLTPAPVEKSVGMLFEKLVRM